MSNTQLPAEVLHTIDMEAQELLAFEPDNRWAYKKGATEYAPFKLKFEAARDLLQKFIDRHEGGLLPDRLLYLEIKTFLDGK